MMRSPGCFASMARKSDLPPSTAFGDGALKQVLTVRVTAGRLCGIQSSAPSLKYRQEEEHHDSS